MKSHIMLGVSLVLSSLLLEPEAVVAFHPAKMPQHAVLHQSTGRSFSDSTCYRASLFDEEESNELTTPATRKFTGGDYMKEGRGGSPSTGEGDMTPRDRMQRREFNLVSRATSPQAFLGQAALILVMLVVVVYVGATGQLGINNDYDDDDEGWVIDPLEPSSVVPSVEMLIPNEKSTSVWL